MSFQLSNFTKEAAIAFDKFKANYLALNSAFKYDDSKAFLEARAVWFDQEGFKIPLADLAEQLNELEASKILSQHVDDLLVSNQWHLIEYAKVMISRQVIFIKNSFPEIIEFYYEKKDDVEDLFYGLFEMRDGLADDEMIKAAQIYFFEHVSWLEELFCGAYPLLPKQLGERQQASDNSGIASFFRLDYPADKIPIVIERIYVTLKGDFIHVSKEIFASHFEPFKAKKKLEWHQSAPLLLLLFIGKRAPRSDYIDISRINFSETNFVKLIGEHFTKPGGIEWKASELYKAQYAVRNNPNHYGEQPILQLIEDIEAIIR